MPVPRVILERLTTEFPEHEPGHVEGLLSLIENDATVPFIARYRKEVTGSMDEERIREIRDRARYLTELESRREAILKSIAQRSKLTPELEEKIVSLRAAGVVNCEMESGLLLTLAGLYGLRAGCICVVSDRAPWPGPSELDIDKNMDACIAVALDGMQRLLKG